MELVEALWQERSEVVTPQELLPGRHATRPTRSCQLLVQPNVCLPDLSDNSRHRRRHREGETQMSEV
eukprot:CAMPEP_0194503808 /NCGR_PEP_ID=MMETSP0253-20130528/28590_1 /TAXON_ID=2966 /ORGANISM="Noctiluca scintillans" /LENGTH=66 /DNA_ID=CAMNT_0039346131 /DNA_START=1 /DNA_END=198 /DNA_ORIENTATION=-